MTAVSARTVANKEPRTPKHAALVVRLEHVSPITCVYGSPVRLLHMVSDALCWRTAPHDLQPINFALIRNFKGSAATVVADALLLQGECMHQFSLPAFVKKKKDTNRLLILC